MDGIAGSSPIRCGCAWRRARRETAHSPSSRRILAEQIRRIIDAGHLRPSSVTAVEHYWQALRDLRGANMTEYWHNSAETICTLLRALPHAPPMLKEPLKKYIQQEWQQYPPYEFTHNGWKGGPRGIFLIPPEMAEFYAGKGARHS